MPNPTKAPLVTTEELTDEQRDMMFVEEELLEADFEAHSDERFPERFLAKRAEIDGLEQHIKEQHKAWLAELAARRRALELRWGPKFRDCVAEDLKGVNSGKAKPRKLIRYGSGQAGMRKAPDKLVIHDEGAATKWAWTNCKTACDIKLARTKPLLELLKASRKVDEKTGEEAMTQIPGVEFVEGGDQPSPKMEALDVLQAPKAQQHTPVLPEQKPLSDAMANRMLSDIAYPAQATAPDGMPF